MSKGVYRNEDGWKLPDASQFTLKEPRRKSQMRADKPVDLYETKYEPDAGSQVVMDAPTDYSPDPFKVDILDLTTFDVNSRLGLHLPKFVYGLCELNGQLQSGARNLNPERLVGVTDSDFNGLRF